jgi:polyisoprenoid-binding protein YceI
MKKAFLISSLFISINIFAQNYSPVDSSSKVHFVIKNFGINTGGDFSNLKGTIHFSPANPSKSHFNVSVSASTIDTDNSMRDSNLKSDEYFDVTKFPEISLVSTKIDKTNKTGEGYFFFTGNLTIKGITKAISFPFHAKAEDDNYLFTGNFQIDRTAFGVGEKNVVLSNIVSVTLSVTAKKD